MPAASKFYPIILMDMNTPWERVLNLGITVIHTPKSIIASYHIGEAPSGLYYIKKGYVCLSNIAARQNGKCR